MSIMYLDGADAPLEEFLTDVLEDLSGRLGIAARTILDLNCIQFRAAGQVNEKLIECRPIEMGVAHRRDFERLIRMVR